MLSFPFHLPRLLSSFCTSVLSLRSKEPAEKNFGGWPLHNFHHVWATPNKQTVNKVCNLSHAHVHRHIFSPLPLLIPSFFHLEFNVVFLSLSSPLAFPYPSIYSSCENLLPSPLSHGQRGEWQGEKPLQAMVDNLFHMCALAGAPPPALDRTEWLLQKSAWPLMCFGPDALSLT